MDKFYVIIHSLFYVVNLIVCVILKLFAVTPETSAAKTIKSPFIGDGEHVLNVVTSKQIGLLFPVNAIAPVDANMQNVIGVLLC